MSMNTLPALMAAIQRTKDTSLLYKERRISNRATHPWNEASRRAHELVGRRSAMPVLHPREPTSRIASRCCSYLRMTACVTLSMIQVRGSELSTTSKRHASIAVVAVLPPNAPCHIEELPHVEIGTSHKCKRVAVGLSLGRHFHVELIHIVGVG
jgi:hypothetical protein